MPEALDEPTPSAELASVAPLASPEPTAATGRPFELPMNDLHALAASAGLEWVNSDAQRIQVVRDAMANEPRPARVPRAPRPRAVMDDGPLVLVETRKDLSQLKLPFDSAAAPRQ
jgi:ribonuclease E